ncbi:ADP-ribosyl cyclase/cyclic ADP-ribose hydrolase-like [Asterias amurensis]|uniref:ADP-ribosyl cyclase/cyclic ADP-ribose hydrolase-like n=1 Tax=Asterias amurensis TaxID=7602 RepID=UPI003AB449FA
MKKVCLLIIALTLLTEGSFGYLQRAGRKKRDSCFPLGSGTTPNIENIFLGRCLDFQTKKAIPDACPPSPVNCNQLWDDFKDAIAYKDPCKIPLDAYDTFIRDVPHQLPRDKTMFWSGTDNIVHAYTEATNTLLTLEDTMLGYMANGLQWCSSTDKRSTGLNFDECPNWWEEGCQVASTAFYSGTSDAIARQATGVITVMLDGSRTDGAFRNDSYFNLHEFPNLVPSQVSRADVIIVKPFDKPLFETCGVGSVAYLESLFKAKGIQFTCTDEDNRAFHIQCSHDPTNELCERMQPSNSGNLIGPHHLVAHLLAAVVMVMYWI